MSLEDKLFPTVTETLQELYDGVDEKQIQLQSTRKEFKGDITLVVFPFLKASRKGPEQTGEEIGQKLLEKSAIIVGFNTVKGFLNLEIANEYWLEQLNTVHQNDRYGLADETGKLTMVEFSSPNTNKPLHLGHLRNIFLGHSVSRILENTGQEVVKTQIINDRGIHICKSMLAWQRFGNGETPESSGVKGDKLVGKYYVKFDEAMRGEIKQLREELDAGNTDLLSDKAKETWQTLAERLKNASDEKAAKAVEGKIKEFIAGETPIMQEAKTMLLKWEAKDPEVYELWKTMNGWVYKGFGETYSAMGVDFDTLYYESDTYITGKELVEKGLSEGVFFEKEDGSVWIDLTDEGLDEKLVLRADGTAVYMTQDIGTAWQRFKDYPNLDGIVYTVGNEQDYHFKVLFLILKKLGFKWAENCYHLSYGMVDLPSGKMKSREGTVVDADELIAEVVEKAREATEERGHIEGMSDEEKENLCNMIGLGGLKYYLLKVDPKKRMLFNPEESVDLNGNTGPFIQYAHARISSLMRKADSISPVDTTVDLHESERELIKQMNLYPDTVSEASGTYSPALICNYVYDLVKSYNSFYQSVSIFKEEDPAKMNMRLVLSQNVGKVIKASMWMLGIDVPDRM
ncbi:MAG: arginine--tRNA ligase [Crocinitomicaceae bacterium]|nr:arginine--tRNA ligase [Crocinitomicaceae bacterium]